MTDPRSISREGRYWYLVDNLHPVDGEDAVVRLWGVHPFTRPGQTISRLALSPEPTTIYEDALGGNRIAYWEIRDFPEKGPLTVGVDFQDVPETARRCLETPYPGDETTA